MTVMWLTFKNNFVSVALKLLRDLLSQNYFSLEVIVFHCLSWKEKVVANQKLIKYLYLEGT